MVDLLLSLALGKSRLAPRPALAAEALHVSQLVRGVETRSARRMRRIPADRARWGRQLARELRAAAGQVDRIASEPLQASDDSDRAAKLRDRERRLGRAVEKKEAKQRALLALVGDQTASASLVTTADLASRLPDRSAAIAIVGFTRWVADPERPGHATLEPQLAALVLRRDARVTLHLLGPIPEVESRVARLRADVANGGEDAPRSGSELRELVLDPVLDSLDGEIDSLFVAVDEALELAPLDALPRDDGAPVGMTIAIRPLVSLTELREPTAVELGDEPTLVALGGIDYADGPGHDQRFERLRSARLEVTRIARRFRTAFPDVATAHVLSGADASKIRLTAHASTATFLHVATHGYFAPETTPSMADAPQRRGTTDVLAMHRGATGLSPLALCGLALAGANRTADDLGRRPGILTAEEILALDLSRCFLVTLSACNTSLGVRRAGQGHASLRAALQGAGARFVLTSLWRVDDHATMQLMADFYRRCWESGDPHRALWQARMAARDRGAPFRDWAGWVLSGK